MSDKVDYKLLKDNDLLLNVVDEVKKNGVVGEEDNIICLIVKIMLRFVVNARSVSSNIVVSDMSGSGKDNLVGAVCRVLLNSDDYECFTHISEKVLAYYDNGWSGKVLHIKDPPFDLLNGSVFKTIAEGGSNALILGGDKKVCKINVCGKPVMVVTSMNINIGEEALRRWDSCQLDTSKELTRAIVRYKLSSVVNNGHDVGLCNALKNGFKPCSVVVPFVDKLYDLLGSTIEVRTLVDKLIDYIRSSAVLYQFQRSKDKYGNIIADWFDYEIGVFVFNHLNSVVGIPLSRDDLELLKLLSTFSDGLFVRSIISDFPRSKDWIYKHLNKLKKIGLVNVSFEFDASSNKEIDRYCVSDDYKLRCGLEKNVFRSVAFDKVNEMFCYLDVKRKELGLISLFDSYMS